MTPEIKIIHQLAVNEIFEITSTTESDLKAWVVNGQYLMSKKLVPAAKNRATSFELDFKHSDILHASLANDCNRFAQAAIESMWSVGKVDKLPKSTGWAAVQMYYSAFFAAHAILRIYGRACTQLEPNHVNKVFEIASATQFDDGVSSIESGFYFSLISNGEIKFKKLKESHADTWSSFSTLLTWLIDNISSTTGLGLHKSDAITFLSEIKAIIHSSGAAKGNWLSQIRNKVNYQHSHGVWFPYKFALHNNEAVLRNAEWLKEPKSFDLGVSHNDISKLYSVSNTILSLMYQLMKYGYERSGKVSVPLTNGTFRLVNQIQVA
ncbi:hypothetical protein [Neptunomonas antarctica]|uniref:Uncharacterized protein n=1 Tax=Neptunomonas antarctica TaxID=619304 RepID=A0A1N7J5F6_9GAMM|nr:hypothetical protein [Neptunomonas antarctica]SIS44544.1 hypothetical protein SAMN05421760_101639 [Neptunomonas antarctica]